MPEKELLLIAKLAGLQGMLSTSTSKIARQLNTSQQTASRKLRLLEKQGLIELSSSPKGINAGLTPKAVSLLRKELAELESVFKPAVNPSISGTLKKGMGEGSYYMSQKKYADQFKKMLGFKPFAGTLNLLVNVAELEAFLSGLESEKVRGFDTGQRSFGAISTFKILVQKKHKAALIFPERSSHPKNEIEIIAKYNFRKKLGLKEGSRVTICPA